MSTSGTSKTYPPPEKGNSKQYKQQCEQCDSKEIVALG